jgi:hypothetical protein
MRNVIDETKWNTEPDFFTRRALREAEIGRFFNSAPNIAQGGLKSYSDWLAEQSRAGLPTDIDPPADVEPREAWRTRMIGTSESVPGEHFTLPPIPPGGERLARARALAASSGIKVSVQPHAPSFTGRALHMMGRPATRTADTTSRAAPYGGERWMRAIALREANAREMAGCARPSLIDRAVYRLRTLVS